MASQKLAAFERALQINRTNLIGEAHRKAFIAFARQELAETLSEQKARSGAAPSYEQTVDGHKGASLESAELGGVIRFDFRYLREIAEFAIEFAREHSPVGPGEKGHYRDNWFLMAGGKPIEADAITDQTEIVLTNDKPYHRKIEVGAMTMSVPPGIVEQARLAVLRRYGNVVVPNVKFIKLAGGWVLRRNHGRKGSRAGDEITYPALFITVRG